MIDINKLEYENKNIDIDNYLFFRDYVKNSMNYPEWLGDFTKNDLEYLLNDGAIIWVYYLDKDPVCSMMLIPSTEKDLSKFEINLDYKEVVDYGPMFVNPKYVGNGLQYQMLKVLDEYCINNGYKYAISTVHPDNVYSINNLVKDEFKLIGQKEFSRGIRNIYLKQLFNANKILTFIVNENDQFLLLKGSNLDPEFHESFWYVVTGSVEDEDVTLEDTVKREVSEETGLSLNKIQKLNWIYSYNSLGKHCIEEMYISYTSDKNISLNEESIGYKWCSLEEMIELIKWYSSKDELRNILKNALENKFKDKTKFINVEK